MKTLLTVVSVILLILDPLAALEGAAIMILVIVINGLLPSAVEKR